MGNDIFSAIMNKKKNMILEYANVFFKYTVNNKNKITKTLSSIIDIYFENFYFNQNSDYKDLERYFSLQNSKDILLKEAISATIKFYQLNNISDKIESDKSTIIIISNVVYLSISLCNRCFQNYNGNIDVIFEQYFNKYSSKIRIKNVDMIDEIKNILLSMIKKDCNSIKKAFKLFETTNYAIDLKKVLDYDNHYLVELNYELRMLSKYSKKEIERVMEKNIDLDLSIISLEQTVLKITYDYLANNFGNKYLVKMPVEVFTRQKYRKLIDEILKVSSLKKNIVVVLNHSEIDDTKMLTNLKEDGFSLALYQVDSLKINRDCFDNVEFVFVPSHFLEMHDGYQEIWSAKGIKFIIS